MLLGHQEALEIQLFDLETFLAYGSRNNGRFLVCQLFVCPAYFKNEIVGDVTLNVNYILLN